MCGGFPWPQLKRLLACNESLAQEAFENFRAMELGRGTTPALLAYDGIQYKYMAPGVFTQAQLEYVGGSTCASCRGFYGVLRPFDGVYPLPPGDAGQSEGALLQKPLRLLGGDSLGGSFLFQEDSVLVKPGLRGVRQGRAPAVAGKGRFVTCVFAEEPEPGRLVEKGVYVKMARGEMVRFAAEHNVQSPEGLQGFSRLGYAFDSQRSTGDTYLFCRSDPAQAP